MYREELLEHYKYPLNNKSIESPSFSAGRFNPSCGDEIVIAAKVEDGKIATIGFQGKGCVISQATASMFTEVCRGKSLQDLQKFTEKDILALIGLELGPVRLKCAVLSLEVLKQGIAQYKAKIESKKQFFSNS